VSGFSRHPPAGAARIGPLVDAAASRPGEDRPVIELRELTKRYRDTTAVDSLTFTVKPGLITGFLGPNGAGKSTTMRLILGLDRPNSGTALVGGRSYRSYRYPLYEVGALLEARSTHPGRTAYHHLRWLAQTHRIGRRRVDQVLELTGLSTAARQRVGGFSLGMSQRLGVAAALLGDPPVLLLDEPMNGLDPEGMAWMRRLLRDLADEGRTVLISSHLMSEMQQLADHLVVIGRGRLVADTTVTELMAAAGRRVRVRSPQPDRLTTLLHEAGATVVQEPDGAFSVAGLAAAEIGDLAAAHRIPTHELSVQEASLEATFLELTRDDVEYHGSTR
jgi:ABC-2 type transport system ATP-binding protein